MAEIVTIPMPLLAQPNPDNRKKTASPSQTTTKNGSKAHQHGGVPKRKQSKSRNGCLTCKAKRLKCDETKPTCQQCAKRGVTCGGYKKDFKWRPFEETNFTGKPPGKLRKGSIQPSPTSAPLDGNNSMDQHGTLHAFTNPGPGAFFLPPQSSLSTMRGPPLITTFPQTSYPLAENMYDMPQSSPYTITPQSISPVDSYASGSTECPVSLFGSESVMTMQTKTTALSSVSSGQSPRLVDLLLPGTDLDIPPEEYSSFRSQHESVYQSTDLTPIVEDATADATHNMNLQHETWIMRLPSPSSSSSSSPSPDLRDFRILKQPQFSSAAPETFTRQYDRDTCGVLSVKDGPTENPWRTLVWPLAHDCPALYHAIASMTSFHHSTDSPAMRIQGIDHFRTAVHALAEGLQNMRFDAAISTTLVLAFSESWDQHISTGINHIKGAKLLIDQALIQHRQVPKQGEEWTRFKFLCNTWIYMDVIARLTSADEDDFNDVDAIHESIHSGRETNSIDPLMGCASTLFPIIGRVASLVKKVRRSNGNDVDIITQAMQLKAQLEKWTPPSFIEDPEDESVSPCDSIKTATAYQYATLLYLHQAVPEIPSSSSSVLAKKVLSELAAVELKSRSTIVHIYPLMAAGCEATCEEDRNWVKTRWALMASKMKLGILDKSLEVTEEVWARRDAYAAKCTAAGGFRSDNFTPDASLKRDFASLSRGFYDGDCGLDVNPKRRMLNVHPTYAAPNVDSNTNYSKDYRESPIEDAELLEPEFTVNGRLHWLGVMKDWNWEGELNVAV
ncbi:hypothetical protein P153DRAFT_287509 [Dothidotthia symphoricarpi CBS 119687]|uniref:Zn(2)-C6 fungal-type domain-containing protein n=1 Tax=Dothidotthia symphoricarpi CBS 119687 TaxID=1392245 RepID=A0A6A6AG16_9PLEO|nr:uncharacterized protein P153DRAFT_287509 [Dothidotthia symphoricarpi CBS 119687]KAF2130730.1 hypothetical protein P153DRAFT_287509 [Dothidotthia symphoricarpi CBS 119687]